MFKHGVLREYDLSASGGSPLFTYFAGVGIEDTDGIEPTSSVERYSGRLNLSSTPSQKINFAVTMGYVNGNIHLPCEAGCGGRTLGTIVNYACHPTTLAWQNTLVSPDYVGALREVVEHSTIPVIASGGISRIEDLRAIQSLGQRIEGAIVGKALYDGKLDLADAIKAVSVATGRSC